MCILSFFSYPIFIFFESFVEILPCKLPPAFSNAIIIATKSSYQPTTVVCIFVLPFDS